MDERVERARLLYERAVFDGDATALDTADRELDAAEADLAPADLVPADLALARGRIAHGRFLAGEKEDPAELALFERAARLYRALGDVRGEGESLFWIGVFHQVVRQDNGTAVPVLERSRELAAQTGDKLTMSYVLRHLGIAEHIAGRLGPARERLEESVHLRRELGFLPGVAANLIGLAYITAAEGRRDEALKVLDEAAELAEATGAHGILRSVKEAREAL
ncbi:MAG TPA: hypothetical protein VM347_27425 [Nonomuraea sp.]|nr:hypothetical protein [Nonomuraea sp.]